MNALRFISGPARRQRGVVLVTALIVLVIMTILGLASINTTTLQSKMTGNLRETNAAFQAAEAGLQAGLIYIEKNFVPPMAGSGAVYRGCTVGSSTSTADCLYLDNAIDDWSGGSTPSAGTSFNDLVALINAADQPLSAVASPPRVLIDERQVRTDMEVGATTYYYYTVSAVGTGPAGQGRSILQTTIVKRSP